MNMARYEQETIINFNEEEKTAAFLNALPEEEITAMART